MKFGKTVTLPKIKHKTWTDTGEGFTKIYNTLLSVCCLKSLVHCHDGFTINEKALIGKAAIKETCKHRQRHITHTSICLFAQLTLLAFELQVLSL